MSSSTCSACRDGVQQPMPFSMAFQPVVDVTTGKAFAYEALVRGPAGEGAGSVLSQVTPENIYAFDQNCRRRAITLASKLNLQETGAKLSINFLPGAVYSPAACIRLTLATANAVNFPLDRLIFELTEREEVKDASHVQSIADEYQKHGFEIALDDFGAGFCNLNLLANLQASILKLDMDLIRNLHERPKAQQVIASMVHLCTALNIRLVAEGIETPDEYWRLRDLGVTLMQGYLFAKPAFEQLPAFQIPSERFAPSENERRQTPRTSVAFPILSAAAAEPAMAEA